MVNIQLNYNYGYKWFSLENIYVKGYIFDKENNLFKDEELINYFKGIKNEDEFRERLIQSNGFFSVIIHHEDNIFVAVDRTRTFPLFYSIKDNKIYITDDTYYLKNMFNSEVLELSSDEFLSTGYVTGKETLLENIYQIQAGEYFRYSHNKLDRKIYADYITTSARNQSFESFRNDFLEVLDRSIKRIISLAEGKQIVLPLSGGYDSRLIASLLKKQGYENVFCFTYGSKDSFEVEISEKVAKELNYNWCFVEYNEETVPQNFTQSKEFQKYYSFASNHVSIFLLQDYFAIKYLHDNCLIEMDAFIVPGHSGDFLGGSHLNKNVLNKSNLINNILEKHYLLSELKYKKDIKEKLTTNNLELCADDFYYSKDENFNLKERQSKFIVNADRVYEYFGYKHTLPLWDVEMIEFFRKLPLEYKLNSFFFEKVILEDIFDSMNIGFRKSKKVSFSLKQRVKKFVKKLLPNFIKSYIISKKYVDINNFDLMCKPIQKEVKLTYSPKNINSLLTNWYIKKVTNEKSD